MVDAPRVTRTRPRSVSIRRGLLAVGAAGSLVLAACGSSGSAADVAGADSVPVPVVAPPDEEFLVVQHGDGATLTSSDDGTWTLTVTEPAPSTISFADSPASDVASEPLEDFVSFVNDRSPAPNATIDWESPDSRLTLAAALSDAAIDADTGALMLSIQPVLDEGEPALYDDAGTLVPLDAESLVDRSVALYVDGETDGCRALILNSAETLTFQEDDKKHGTWAEHPPQTIERTPSNEFAEIRVHMKDGACGWSAAYTTDDGGRVRFSIKSTTAGHGDKRCDITDNPNGDLVCTKHNDTSGTDVFFHVGYTGQNIS